MTNRIVDTKEFRTEFRKQVELICDFSQRKSRHCLGIAPRQMTVDVAVDVINAIKTQFQDSGRTLDKALANVQNPTGARIYASQQLGQMARITPVEGANIVETLWKTFGEIIPVARRGRINVYVAKNGATAMEWSSVGDLRAGKTSATVKRDEVVQDILAKGRSALGEMSTGEAYAATCTEYFKAVAAE
jgi:hypothetical protein